MRKVLILGAGSFALEAADVAKDLGWQVAGYVVDVKAPKTLRGKPVHDANGELPSLPCVCGIVSPERIGLVRNLAGRGFKFLTSIHPDASVSFASLWGLEGTGSLVNRGAVVSRDSFFGCCVVVNRNASVGHDCTLGECCTVGPGANLAGGVIIGERAVVGMGANVREGVQIGTGAVVGMGAVVLQDVPDGETWWGVPARKANHD